MGVIGIGGVGFAINLESASTTANLSVRCFGGKDGSTVAFDFKTTGTPIIRNQWNHILVGIKQSTNNRKIIANKVDEALTVATFSTTNIAATAPDTSFFAMNDGSGALISNYMIGGIWQPWVDAGSGKYFDPVSNLSKFIDSGGHPVDLGPSGEIPTGVKPAYFLKSAPASYGTNSGDRGNLTIVGAFGSITPPT